MTQERSIFLVLYSPVLIVPVIKQLKEGEQREDLYSQTLTRPL